MIPLEETSEERKTKVKRSDIKKTKVEIYGG